MAQHPEPDRLLMMKDVCEILARSRASVYRDIEAGRFPKPIKLNQSSRWANSEIQAYIKELKTSRGSSNKVA